MLIFLTEIASEDDREKLVLLQNHYRDVVEKIKEICVSPLPTFETLVNTIADALSIGVSIVEMVMWNLIDYYLKLGPHFDVKVINSNIPIPEILETNHFPFEPELWLPV